MRFLYLGQTSMGNRGCEALIRSTTALIRERLPDARFLCPSDNVALDLAQWPDAPDQGIEFVDVLPFAKSLKWWNRLRRVVPGFGRMPPPPYPLAGQLKHTLERVDAVLMTGGDIISLDYEIFSLSHWAGLVDACARAGKPVHLLAASVGPFGKDPRIEARMRDHLANYRSISVRETPSLAYTRKLGREDAVLVADPAFTMTPQSWDSAAFFPQGASVLGLNVSPLIRETRGDDAAKRAFDGEIVDFIERVATQTPMNIVLAPHVYPLDSSEFYSDHAYLSRLMAQLPAAAAARTSILPKALNTAQIKFAIGQCRYFMGARTHATVASLSQSVPTCSIAYSIKALGINQDLFGDTRYVLPTPEVSAATLWQHFEILRSEEDAIKALLDKQIPTWKQKTRDAIGRLTEVS